MNRTAFVFGTTALLIVVGALLFRPDASADAPRLPTNDDEVLERLPGGRGDPRARERDALRLTLAARPDDLATAVTLARLDIEQSRARSDPRYLGYAQAALAQWWQIERPPAEVLLLRATIRQSLHDFDGALADLDEILRGEPDDGQAWITRSVVLTVRGRYDEARASCAPLSRISTPLVVAVCNAIDAVTGKAAIARSRISSALARAPRASDAERAWATSLLGETCLRLGKDEDAEQTFLSALAMDPDDAYVLAAYADLLLDVGREADAARLVAGRIENDGLLLRLALAEAKTHAPEARAHADLLGARFDASHLRGDAVHRREEARFRLGLRSDPRGALELARTNWDVQKEPWDARVYLEAAVAAGSVSAAAPVLAFLGTYQLEDPRIRALAARLGSAAP